MKKFRAVPSQGPEATSRHRPAGRRLGAGHRQALGWRGPPSCPLWFPRPGLTSNSKKGDSEGFLEPAPRGLSVLGRSKRGRAGPGKAEKKAEARQRARPPLKLSLTRAREGGGGPASPAAGRQARVLKNVSNSCGNQRDCKSPPSPTHLLPTPLSQTPESSPPHPLSSGNCWVLPLGLKSH